MIYLSGSGSEWHSDKMKRCVNLAQRQNDTVRHFGTVCHFGTEDHFSTATKCLIFFFFIIFFRFLGKIVFLTFCSFSN